MSTTSSYRIQEAASASPGSVRPLSTAVKTLRLLEYLGSQDHPVRLAEIANSLRISRSTIYQRLVTLVEAGWVEQRADGLFRLTMLAVKVAGAAVEQAGLGDRVLPTLEELVAETGETASLAVIRDRQPCIIQRVEAGGALQARAQIGTSMPLPTSASGRVLLAFAHPDELEALRAAGATLPEASILQDVRRLGFGTAAGISGVGAVAAPVFDHRQHCIAAVSLVGPEARFDVARMSPSVLAAAARLTRVLGGAAPAHFSNTVCESAEEA